VLAYSSGGIQNIQAILFGGPQQMSLATCPTYGHDDSMRTFSPLTMKSGEILGKEGERYSFSEITAQVLFTTPGIVKLAKPIYLNSVRFESESQSMPESLTAGVLSVNVTFPSGVTRGLTIVVAPPPVGGGCVALTGSADGQAGILVLVSSSANAGPTLVVGSEVVHENFYVLVKQ